VPDSKVLFESGRIRVGETGCSAGVVVGGAAVIGGDTGAGVVDAFSVAGGATVPALADLLRLGRRPSEPSLTAKIRETTRNMPTMPPMNHRKVCPGVSRAGGM